MKPVLFIFLPHINIQDLAICQRDVHDQRPAAYFTIRDPFLAVALGRIEGGLIEGAAVRAIEGEGVDHGIIKYLGIPS